MLNVRNIAVIAHVDHGKTTLVDALLKQTNVFRDNEAEMTAERILDTNELERERGITILAKTCSIEYKGVRINIIDTPGHADFSGEVERTLGMADGALLIIDAQEGPMPQTRFVLKKALELKLKILVVINKIDKKLARVPFVENRLSDLFLELATSDSQLDFATFYAVARQGAVFSELPSDPHQEGAVVSLLEAIVNEVPVPTGDPMLPFKLLVSALDYDPHLGRIVIGKVAQGQVTKSQKVVVAQTKTQATIGKVMVSAGLGRVEVDKVLAGDIVALAGLSKAEIGQTITDPSDLAALAAPLLSEPTLHMIMGPNTSPFSGREGKFTTSRQIGERLKRELQNNVSLKVDFLDNGKFRISGKGELHLAVLLETMRREGYEIEVSKPTVITKKIDDVVQEPVEELTIVVPSEYVGVVTQELGKRIGQMVKMEPASDTEVEFLYRMPTRALLGLRSVMLTQTKGTVLFNSQVVGYQPVEGSMPKMRKGALIAAQQGKAAEYGLRNVKGRGMSFVTPGTQVYEGMIVGQNSKDDDVEINVCKEKHLTNHRSKSHVGITQLAPDVSLSLEQSIDFLEGDELLEITPESLRLRKQHLTDIERRRARRPELVS